MHRLVTWKCGHFVIEPNSPAGTGTLEVSLESRINEDHAWKMLEDYATDQHLALPCKCPSKDCQGSETIEATITRAKADLADLKLMVFGGKKWYAELGTRYYKADFSQKSCCAFMPECALAHTQFCFSSTPAKDDQLISMLLKQQSLLFQTESLLHDRSTIAMVKLAFVKMNSVKAIIGKLITPMDELSEALDIIECAPLRKRTPKWVGDSDELPSRAAMLESQAWNRWNSRLGADWCRSAVKEYHALAAAKVCHSLQDHDPTEGISDDSDSDDENDGHDFDWDNIDESP